MGTVLKDLVLTKSIYILHIFTLIKNINTYKVKKLSELHKI